MKIDFDAVSAKYKTLQEKEQVNASRPLARLPSRAFRALLPLYTLKKMISACKQSIKWRTPSLNGTTKLSELLKSTDFAEYQKFIAYVDENHTHHLLDLAKAGGKYLILIGPEGDFDPKEIQLAFAQGFQAVSLGKSRLRTETAGLAAVQMLQVLNR